MAVIFNTKSLKEESITYDEVTDRVSMIIHTDNVDSVAQVILDPDNLSSIYTETDVYKGYTQIRTFTSRYDAAIGKFVCFISLESDESTHEKLLKRIKALESTKTELVNDVRNLQKVNLVDLVKEKLVSDDLASALTIAGKNDKIIDGYIEIMDGDTSSDKQIEGQVSLKDPDGKIVMEGDISK